MSLKQEISKNYLIAFKAKNVIEKNLLSVIKGEIQNVEKNDNVADLSDEGVLKILNKINKSLKESYSLSNSEKLAQEITIVESYLPKQMSREEISTMVENLIASGAKNMGDFMKAFAGLQVDRKMVNEVVNSFLVKK